MAQPGRLNVLPLSGALLQLDGTFGLAGWRRLFLMEGVPAVLLVCSVGLNWASTPVFWAATTEHLSGVAAAAAIALINSTAQFAGMGLPPLVGCIKDATGSYQPGILMIAAALAIGGLLGLQVGPKRPVNALATLETHA
ncbi:hypothetical protein [Acidisphaera sp. L21]|uniref:hypothetical protein n=1 Tax=Acidisphaera sp. L21 TaxID=1641851 RepID=UPI00131E8CE1|nr:hypothetical protein [Acidisphaera sp. L21]